MAEQNILDKSIRSVFVGNIPYDATEEKLKDIFNEVGPVISFKLVYDRETGKPKGYGFCEYKDQETALSAMRNLNSYEIGGRTLRVDNACTEKSRLEMQSLMMGMPTSESIYGNPVNAKKAPEIINKLIVTLSPEQLFELIKQMKECIQNNPVESRNMLLQNPQLGYALLQVQVVMKIINPEFAKTMLYPIHKVPTSISNINVSNSKSDLMPYNNNQQIISNPSIIQSYKKDWNVYHGHKMITDFSQPPPSTFKNVLPKPIPLRYFSRPLMDLDNRIDTSYKGCITNSNYITIPPPIISEAPPLIQPFSKEFSQGPHFEKDSLLFQVLQLTNTQIAMLPVDQRQSIIQLKKDIAFSSRSKE